MTFCLARPSGRMTIRAKSCVINNGWEVELPHHLLSPVSGQEGGTFEGEYIPNRQNALERGCGTRTC